MARRKRKTDSEETTYWLSYSDMMAALLLVFILLITLTMFHAQRQFDEKEAIIEQDRIEAERAQKKAKEQQKLIEKQQEQIDRIIGVREELITVLKEEFAGSDLAVSVDSKTGAITFDSSILFDVNMYDLKPKGEQFLRKFLPRYLNILMGKQFKDYVSEIIIEGHTDTNGTYMNNLQLSQKRAFSVASFCLQDESKLLGKSIDLDASRRVEFKFRLQHEQMVEDLSNIFKK